MLNAIIIALAAIILGPTITFSVYWAMNALVLRTPDKYRKQILPYVFIGPVLALVFVMLVYPTFKTLQFSFMDKDGLQYVGLRNYTKLLTNIDFLYTLRNNVLWVAVVPIVTVIMGLGIATLANNVKKGPEKIFKSIIFMPMAISFVAASSIWRLTYSYQPDGKQVGLLNAIWTSFGNKPVAWMQVQTGALNSLLIMVIVVWSSTGFAMTLLSAAIKAVPEETLEAASIDGANKYQTFFRIVVPQIKGTAISVFITVLISSMKIFDVIWGMTGGNFHTNVLGVDFMLQYFVFNNQGKATAIVVMLMIAIIPIMFYQVRHYRKQEMIR